jgi:hypothetical protein
VQLRSDLAPEFFGVGFGFLVETLILLNAFHVGMGAKLIGTFKDAMFGEDGVDIILLRAG